jgi:hypothetical protein
MSAPRIPKIAHYIWIGDAPMPALVERCVASFHKHLPEYQLILWDNVRAREVFDQYPFAREALDARVYAFASDVIRLYALYHYGGIYLDSDVELFGSLDPFLEHQFFSGFQDPEHAITAVMGAERGSPFVEMLLADYRNRSFLDKSGNPDLTTNTRRINQHLVNAGIQLNDTDQVVGDGIAIYRREIFCPFHPKHGGEPTEATVAMHHFNASWVDHRKRLKKKQRRERRIRRWLLATVIGAAAVLALALYW